MLDGSGGNMAAALVQMACLYRGRVAVRIPGLFPGLAPGLVPGLAPGLAPVHFRTFSLKKEPELEDNPFYNNYQEKIRRLRSSKPEEFKTLEENRLHKKKEPLGYSTQGEFIKKMEEELEKRDQLAAGGGAAGGFTKDKTLGSILNLDLTQDMTGEDISELWKKFYSTKDTISAVISAETFELLFSRAQSCPTFLFAVPHEEGYEFFLGQWSGQQLHFTSLINAQRLGDHAPSQLILYHYTEVQASKGVVLMTAERDPTFITVHQAQCLANQVQLFYGKQETFRLWCSSLQIAIECQVQKQCMELRATGPAPGRPLLVVTLYYDSLCPGCRVFLTQQLYPTWTLLKDIMTITLVPYTRELQSATSPFSCQHGGAECNTNMMEACILHLAGDASTHIINCMESSGNALHAARPCVEQYWPAGSWAGVEGCVGGGRGLQLIRGHARRTLELDPAHTHLPWITFDGEHSEEMQDKALSSLFHLVCDLYKGGKPPVCTGALVKLDRSLC
ncbi:hypothetical protein NHX12_032865 [Muraenolepis orangiensis]|uniref:Gamma-interferon-inducible lysosomal thiol reductase n=1 Tax=Muraenolepis orangiensis TaxID=630683 RepID=A0A9Q0IFU0_9TELE|nr:hypothetical protein NHX12_032865 [Muraenolepis orangiensis]